MKVIGKKLFEGFREIKLSGFSLWSGNVFYATRMPITIEVLQKIKDWGFNTINLTAFWGADIEPDQYSPGIYNENKIQRIEEVIQLANEVGLYVIFSMRVSHGGQVGEYPTWQGWPREYYFVDSITSDAEIYRQRFYTMMAMMIDRLDKYPNLIGYNWWFFPWHIYPWTDRIPEEVDVYYNNMVPNLIGITRAKSNKIIFFSAYKQGSHSRIAGEPWYEIPSSSEYHFITPIADSNVVYCHGFHRPSDIENTAQINYDPNGNRIPWNYDISFLQKMLQPGIDFSNKYDVPMMSCEFGLQVIDYPDVVQTGEIAQDRLDCYDAKLTLMDKNNYNWIYWTFNGPIATVLKDDVITPYAILDVLKSHITMPIFPWGFIARIIGPIGVGLYLITRIPRRG